MFINNKKLVLAFLFIVSASQLFAQWYDSSWLRRQRIDIDVSVMSLSASVNNFPVLVELTGANELFTQAQTNGYDILFTRSDGVTKLSHEIQDYDSGGNSLQAWVKIPVLSNTTTVIYMYYGNPSAGNQEDVENVWDADFEAVLHLEEDGSTSTYQDSTYNNRDAIGGTVDTATSHAPEQYSDSQTITYGQEYAGDHDTSNDDRIDVGNWNVSGQELTMSAWFNVQTNETEDYRIISKSNGGSANNHIFMLGLNNGDNFRVRLKTDDNVNTTTYFAGTTSDYTWYYVTAVYDGTRLYLYGDGVLLGSTPLTGAISSNAWNIVLGNNDTGYESFEGFLDEIRMAADARSQAWIKTQYEMQLAANRGFSAYDTVDSNKFIKYLSTGLSYQPYTYKKKIVINGSKVEGSGSHTDFPVLVKVSYPAGAVQSSNGYDIIFTDNSGTVLSHEIDNWNASTNTLTAWVKVPSLSTSADTVLYTWYGNASVSTDPSTQDVWSAYTGVYHMSSGAWNGTSQEVKDSTGVNNGVTANGTSPTTTGKFGNAAFFDGVDDYIELDNESNFQLAPNGSGNSLALSAWVQADPDSVIQWQDLLTKGDDTWRIIRNNTSDSVLFAIENRTSTTTTNATGTKTVFENGVWHYVTAVFDSTSDTMYLYVDGVLDATATCTHDMDFTGINGNLPVRIGSNAQVPTRPFDGIMDEVRLSGNNFSADWIKTEFNNQNDTTTGTTRFIKSIGPSEAVNWDNTAWSYRKNITINHEMVGLNNLPKSDSDLTNMPVLIDINDSQLTSNAGLPTGADVYFVKDGVKLKHEVAGFNSATGDVSFWVNIPDISSSADTTITMYYGNAGASTQEDVTGTWSKDFEGVWHLDEDGQGQDNAFKDSSPKGRDGSSGTSTITGNVPALGTGQTGGAQVFTGTETIDAGIFDPSSGDLTITGWINWTDNAVLRTILAKRDSNVATDMRWQLDVATGGVLDFVQAADTGHGFTNTITQSAWQHFALVQSGTGYSLILNGNTAGAETTTFTFGSDTAARIILGAADTTVANPFIGTIDEIRMSSTARSDDWIIAEYNFGNTPGSYLTFTPETQLITFDGSTDSDWNDATNWDVGDIPDENGEEAVIPNGLTAALDVSPTLNRVTVQSGGTLDLAAYTLTVDAGGLENQGTILFSNASSAITEMDSDSGLVQYSASMTLAAFDYYNLTINGAGITTSLGSNTVVYGDLVIGAGDTFDMNGSNLTVHGSVSGTGTLTIGSGTLTVYNDITVDNLNGNTGTVLVGKNFSVAGFASGNSTVRFTDSGLVSSINGNNHIFHNLEVLEPGKTLLIDNTTNQTITNALTIQGALGQEVVLDSDAVAVHDLIVTGAAVSVTYADIAYSMLDVSANAVSSIDSGNNTNWQFNPAGVLDYYEVSIPTGDIIAGIPFDITITAKDSIAADVTIADGTVSISDGTSTISPSVSGNFGGNASVTVSVTISDPYVSNTITVSDGSITGQSGSFAVIEYDPGSGLVGHWPLSDSVDAANVPDNSGNGYDLVFGGYTSGDKGVSGGPVGYSYNFDGTDNVLYRNSATDLNTVDDFSLTSWFKRDAGIASEEIIAGKTDDGAGFHGYRLSLNASGYPVLTLVDSVGNSISAEYQVNLADGNFHHVAAVYDDSGAASGITLYIDGFAVTPVTASSGVFNSNDFDGAGYFAVGASYDAGGGANYFNGTMAGTRFYNAKQLSAAEVLALYEGERTPLQITGYTLAADNSYVDVTFSAGVYTDALASAAVVPADFSVSMTSAGGATAVSLDGITRTDGSALAGGETTVRLELSYTGTADGTETIEIQPAANREIFDAEGNEALSSQTSGDIPLNDISTIIPVILLRETHDSDSNGTIDRIKITTDAALNDSFTGLTVEINGVAASSYETGTANDAVFFAVLAAEIGNTASLPNVEVTGNSSLGSNASGDLLAVDAGSVPATDAAPPVLLSAEGATSGTTLNVAFSEAVYSTSGGTVPLVREDFVYTDASGSDAAALNSMVDADGSDSFVALAVDVAFDMTNDTADTLAADANEIFDAAGNPAGTAAVTLTDSFTTTAQPVGAVIGDLDANGYIDTITIAFDDDINGATIAAGDFLVIGYSITGAAIGAANEVVLTLVESGTFDTGARPDVTYTPGGLEDTGMNVVAGFTITATDNTRPIVLGITPGVLTELDAGTVNVTITFSEAMDTTVNPSPVIPGLASSPYTIGGSSWTVGDTVWTGTFTLVDDNETVTTFYRIESFIDANSNVMNLDTSHAVDVDTTISQYVWDGSDNSLWSNGNNWTSGSVPPNGSQVVIPDVYPNSYPVADIAITLDTLEIQTGSSLSMNGNDVSVTTTFTNNGTLMLRGNEATVSLPASRVPGLVEYIGNNDGTANTFTLTAGSAYTDLQINSTDTGVNADTFQLGAPTSATGNISVLSGILDLNSFNITAVANLDVDDNITGGNSETITVSGTADYDRNGPLTIDYNIAGTGLITVNTTGGASNVAIQGTVSSNTGNIDMVSSSNITFNASGQIISTSGNVSLQAASGTITMNAAAQVNAGSGTIDIDADGTITLAQLTTTNATASAVNINSANGSILPQAGSGTNITASDASAEVTLIAVTGIGALNTTIFDPPNALETNVLTFSLLRTDGAGSEIAIDNTASASPLTITQINPGNSTNGSALLTHDEALTVSTLTTGGGENDNIGFVATGALLTLPGATNVGTGDVRFEAADITDGDADIDVSADLFYIRSASTEVLSTTVNSLDAVISGTNTLTVNETDGLTVVNAQTADGNVTISSTTGNILIDQVVAGGTSTVDIDAISGAISDNSDAVTDITADIVQLDADSGIGTGNALETAIGTLAAVVDTSGSIQIANTIPLIIDTVVSNGVEVTAGAGTIAITADDTITINQDVVTNNGNITITAETAANADITMADGTSLLSGGNLITLNAARTVSASIINAGAANIDLNADTDTNGSGSITDSLSTAAPNVIGAAVTMDAAEGMDLTSNVTSINANNTTSGTILVDEAAAGGALTVTRALQGAAGTNIDISTANGSLTISTNGVTVSGTGTIDLSAVGGDLNINQLITSAAGAVTLSSDASVAFAANGDISSTGGLIDIDGLAGVSMSNGTVIASGGGGTSEIDIDATGTISLGQLTTTRGGATVISVTSTAGAITDANGAANNITADAAGAVVDLDAALGIGAADAIETTIAVLQAEDTNIATVNTIQIAESNGIELDSIINANGSVDIDAGGAVDITSVVSSTDADTNDINLYTSTGNITIAVGGIDAGSLGDVFIDTDNGSILDTGAGSEITCDQLTMDATAAIGSTTFAVTGVSQLDVDTTGGLIDIDNTADANVSIVSMNGTGAIRYTQTGNTYTTTIRNADSSANTLIIENNGTGGTILLDSTTDISASVSVTVTSLSGNIQASNSTAAAEVISPIVILNAVNGSVGSASNTIDVSGNTQVSADTSTANGDVYIDATADMLVNSIDAGSGDVYLTAGSEIYDHAADAVNDIVCNILEISTVDGVGSTEALEVQVGTSIDVLNTTNGNIDINSTGALDIERIINQAGTGNITINSTGQIDVLAAGGGVVNQSNNATITLQTLAGNIVLNDAVTSDGGDISIISAANINANTNGEVNASVNGNTGAVLLTANAGANTINLAENVTTYNGSITLTGSVLLAADVSLDTTSVTLTTGGNITINGTVNNARILTIDAGTAGNINFNNSVGGVTPLTGITVVTNNDFVSALGASIEAGSFELSDSRGSVVFNDTIETSAAAGIDLTGAAFRFMDTITTTGTGPLTIDNSGNAIFDYGADMSLSGAFTKLGTGNVLIAAGLVSGSTISFSNAASTTFIADYNEDEGGTINLNAGSGTIAFSGDVHMYAPGITVQILDNFSMRNFFFYAGTIGLNGQTLSTNQDCVLLGNTYNADDAATGIADLFSYEASGYTRPSAASSTRLSSFMGGLITFTEANYNADFTDLAGSTINVTRNFYTNGINLSGNSGNWTLSIPNNNNATAGFAEAHNTVVDYCQAATGWVAAAEGSTDSGNNSQWDFTRPVLDGSGVTATATVYDNVIRVVLDSGTSTNFENTNNEISAAVGELYTDSEGATFAGTYTDAECTTSTDGQGDMSTFYVQLTSGRWNTDAEGTTAGTGTDRGRGATPAASQSIVPNIGVPKATGTRYFTLLDEHKNRIPHYMGGTRFTAIADNCDPVLILMTYGTAAHTNPASTAYDGHNYIQLTYSEPVNMGNSAGFTIADASAANIRAQGSFGAIGEYGGGISSTATTAELAGYIEWPATAILDKVSRDATPEVNSLYRTSTDSITFYIGGYSTGSGAATFWPGYFDNLSVVEPGTDTTIFSLANVNIKDANGNILEETDTSSDAYPKAEINAAQVGDGWDTDPPVFAAYSGATDTAEIVTKATTGSVLNQLEVHILDDSTTVWDSANHPDTDSGIRDSSLANIKAFEVKLMIEPDTEYDNQLVQTGSYNTVVDNSLFGANINLIDDPYFSFTLEASGNPYSILSQLAVRYNADIGFITDLAGNRLPSADGLNTLERMPPRMTVTLGQVGLDRVYVRFNEPANGGIGNLPIEHTDFTLSSVEGNSITGMELINPDSGNFVEEIILELANPLGADDATQAVIIPVAGEIFDELDNSMPVTNDHRVSDLGLGLVEPVWASDGINDDTVLGANSGVLRVFDGTGALLDRDILLQAIIHGSSNTNAALSLYYDIAPPATAVFNDLWLPASMEDLVPVANTDARSVLPSAVDANLRDFYITSLDEEITDGAAFEFVFRLDNLYCARPTGNSDPREYEPFGFDIRALKKQRGGVTILNNVINPLQGDVAVLTYDLPMSGMVTVNVIGLDGSIVELIHRGSQAAGTYTFTWDGRNASRQAVARGLYFIRVVGPGIDQTRKVMVVK